MMLGSVALLVFGKPTHSSLLIGIPVVIVGEAIRLWASGYIVKLDELITAGPFALCRNPLYAGSFVTSVGYFTICNRLEIWIVGTVLFWLFHAGAVAYEEKILRERHGAKYEEYFAAVPRFIPRPRRLAGNGSFSFAQLMQNREYRGAVGAALMVLLFFLKARSPAFAPFDWLVSHKP